MSPFTQSFLCVRQLHWYKLTEGYRHLSKAGRQASYGEETSSALLSTSAWRAEVADINMGEGHTRSGGSSLQPLPLALPPLSTVLLCAGLHKMDFPGCANLAATCSRCAGASKVALLQTQSSWESGCQASLSPLLPSFVAALASSHPVTCWQLSSPFSSVPQPLSSP